MMTLGYGVIADAEGNITERFKVIIEDGATTTECRNNHYTKGWVIKDERD